MEASVVSPARTGSLWAALGGWWVGARGYQRLAYGVGAGLLLVGLAHAAIWALAGGSASGAVSWRKPTTFGISFGLTTVTLGWVATWLPVRRAIGWTAAGLLGAAVSYEVAWVVVQHARGCPPTSTTPPPLDERLFIAGAVMVAVAIGVIAAMTLAALVHTTAPAPLAVAIRWGLVGLLAAQATGVWMLGHGLGLLADDADPVTQSMSTVGAAGSLKFAHAVPMHAIQVLVVLAWVLSRSGLPPRRQPRLVALAVVGYGGLFRRGAGPYRLRAGAGCLGRRLDPRLPAGGRVVGCLRGRRRHRRRYPAPPRTFSQGLTRWSRRLRCPRCGPRSTATDGELTQRRRQEPEGVAIPAKEHAWLTCNPC
jgi:hypothetical protein